MTSILYNESHLSYMGILKNPDQKRDRQVCKM